LYLVSDCQYVLPKLVHLLLERVHLLQDLLPLLSDGLALRLSCMGILLRHHKILALNTTKARHVQGSSTQPKTAYHNVPRVKFRATKP
jgi:hypothetical protein